MQTVVLFCLMFFNLVSHYMNLWFLASFRDDICVSTVFLSSLGLLSLHLFCQILLHDIDCFLSQKNVLTV